MTATMPADDSAPLSPDDPRLSEWIDGRLPAAEAAAVEEAVGRSEQLSRLVADLRAIKAAAASLPAMEPPAGFVDQVMQAVAETSPGGDDDRIVAEEWREIETERLAGERAEADADADLTPGEPGSPSQGRPWPWMSLAGALAAGLLVTVLLNLPGDEAKQVAMVPGGVESETAVDEPEAADMLADLPAAVEADQVAGGDRVARKAAGSPEAAALPANALARAAGPGSRGDAELRSGRPSEESARRQLDDGDPAAPAAVAAARLRTQPDEKLAANPEAAASLTAAAPLPPEVITIQVWGAEGRKELGELLVASGLRLEPAETAGDEAGPKARQEAGRDAAAVTSLLGDEAVFLVGPADEVAAFLTRVGADGVAPGETAAEETAGAEDASGGARPADRKAAAATAPAPVRVLIRVREAPGFTPPAPQP